MLNKYVLIPLTRGLYTKVDARVAHDLSEFSWHAKAGASGNFYAEAPMKIRGRFRQISLARFLMRPSKTEVVDHINGNTLDNRRCNLRVCSRSENGRGFRKKRAGYSKYRGVTWQKASKKWMAQIRLHLGLFDSERKAARAYDSAARKLYGEFATPNFPA